jgi:hypothetical protein
MWQQQLTAKNNVANLNIAGNVKLSQYEQLDKQGIFGMRWKALLFNLEEVEIGFTFNELGKTVLF